MGGGRLEVVVFVFFLFKKVQSPVSHRHFDGSAAPRLSTVSTVVSVSVAPSLRLKGGQFGSSRGRVLGSAD